MMKFWRSDVLDGWPIRFSAVVAALTVFCLGMAGQADGEEYFRFLKALREHGYHDVAAEYLKDLKTQSGAPRELLEVWDLEMSQCLQGQAASAYDDREYRTLTAESQKYLTKFIEEHPQHPGAAQAMMAWGESLEKRALDLLRRAKEADGKDKRQRESDFADARRMLQDAQKKFREAEKNILARLESLPPVNKSAPKRVLVAAAETRSKAEADYFTAQFQAALVNYYLLQTEVDLEEESREEKLRAVAAEMDAIFQRNRGVVIGLYAHMWQGKTLEELGELTTAADIYDEVLAYAPEPSERDEPTGLEPLFAQVEQFRLGIVKKKRPLQYLSEATAYLRDFSYQQQTEGYQAIALDVVRALVAEAKQTRGPERNKLINEAVKIAAENAKVRSQSQQGLYALRRAILGQVGSESEATTFQEAVNAGDAAAMTSQWARALEYYRQAIELARKTKRVKAKDIDAVQEAMVRVQWKIAAGLYNDGKLKECFDMVGKAVRDDKGQVRKNSDAAAQASALGVQAALALYAAASAEQQPTSLERLDKIAEFTEKNWPEKPEADDARMARGQAKLVVGQVDGAIAIYEQVNPKSERYPTAMYWAGQNYWRLYLAAKREGNAASSKEKAAVARQKAVTCLRSAVDVLRARTAPGEPMPKHLLESQLLLAESHAEAGEIRAAADLLQPLVRSVQAEGVKTLDPAALRVFVGAIRAYCELNELEKAAEVGKVLMDLGEDAPQVNDALIQFARLLNQERKKADARAIEAGTGVDVNAVKAAEKNRAAVDTLLGEMLAKLAGRKELGIGQRIFLGEAMNAIGMTNQASVELQTILKQAETDPEFAKQARRAMSRIRTELLKALRKQGKHEEALQQVEQLIAENRNALEPLMEKGRILEAMAERDPTKYQAAIDHWVVLRNRMQGMRNKPREYYDVLYNVAHCLVLQAEAGKEKAKTIEAARQAELVLKSPLILNPQLNGPDTVAKYQVLLKQAIHLQGRTEEKAEKKP